MKRLITFILGAFLLWSCNSNPKKKLSQKIEAKNIKSINIKGSETVLPISEKAASLFAKNNTQSVSVTGGGSGVGIAALLSGNTNIAQSSRKIKFSEQQKSRESGNTIKEVITAYDALAVIVNPENKIGKLTRKQLEEIFTGKITNWKEIGGEDLQIVPYSRETSSGTYEFFKEHVLQNKNFMSGIMSMPANGAVIQSVSQTKGAIAYVGLAYLNSSVKGISVSFDEGKSYAEPTVENAKNKTYPIVRPLYYYYLTESESVVKKYMDFILSSDGQQVVEELGYITLN